ncbi:MAG: SH3 domain-containing protein [Thermoanaerobaculaceae bacterium]|nr:SH3 domain-containing protein [Thermoanaerobaculaceae bacterium]
MGQRVMCMAAIGMLVVGAVWAGEEKFLWVEPEKANVRAEPRGGAAVIAKVSFGERLLAVDKVEDWYRVQLGEGQFGYIHEGVVTDDAPGHVWVTAPSATVRKSPRSGGKVVAVLEHGTMLESDGARDGWEHVRFGDGKSGWVREEEIDDDPPETLFVVTDGAVLHAAPNPESEVVASLHLGSQLEKLESAGPFTKVRTADGAVGFVYEKAVDDDRPTWLFVKVSETPVMSAPSMESEVLTTLASGAEVLAFDEREDFYLVLLEDGRPGWVHEDSVIPMGKR